MMPGHALEATAEHAAHFRRACSTKRCVCNWSLAEWKRLRDAGEKPSADKIKRRWNAHRKAELSWIYEVTKCASGQVVIDLGAAFANFFRECKPCNQRNFRNPRFKKESLNQSFALWNDHFDVSGRTVLIAKLGEARLREELRFAGKIMGAVVSSGGRWFLSVQIETDFCRRAAPEGSVCGLGLGSRMLATIAGENNKIERIRGPRPRERLLSRIKRMQRRISRQKYRVKKLGQKASRRQHIRQLRLSRLHARVANIRKDAAHKLTNDHSLAGAVLDWGFGEIRRQLERKAPIHDKRTVVAGGFFPSTQSCSRCDAQSGPNGCEELRVERWVCCECGAEHDRDGNAAISLRKLGVADAEERAGTWRPLPASAVGASRTETRTFVHI